VVVSLRPAQNPFRGDLDLRLDLPRPAPLSLELFDAAGRLVRRLDLGLRGAGAHRLFWDGRNEQGRDVGSGVFWARTSVGEETFVQKVVRTR
jgi:flagellar hook assembly protein FlgD